MRKFNWLDALIILVILVVGLVGFKFIKKKAAVTQTVETKKLFFVFETNQGQMKIAENFKVGGDIVFGEAKIAKGVIVSKEIVPYKQKTANLLDGTFIMQTVPERYSALLRIEFDGVETETAYKSGDEQLNIGQTTLVTGVGINSNGTIIDIGSV